MALKLEELICMYHQTIADTFSKFYGDKYLCVDSSLLKLLDRIADMTFLKSLGIVKVFHMSDKPVSSEIKKIIYILPPTHYASIDMLKILRTEKHENISRHSLITILPKCPLAIRHMFESEGLIGYQTILTDLPVNWIPLDYDLLSLHLPQVFTASFMEHDHTWANHMGMAIGEAVVRCLSSPPYACNVYSYGQMAGAVHAGLNSYCKNAGANFKMKDNVPTSIFLFSREVDFVTPFCTPLNYEALLNEVIGINLGIAEFSPEITGESKVTSLFLNSKSHIYRDIRDLPISLVSDVLKEKKGQIDNTASKVQMSRDIASYSNFVKNDLKEVTDQRRVLNCVFSGLSEIIRQMTEEERVEDIMQAQQRLLASMEDWNKTKELIVEWLSTSTNFGARNRVMEALRLLCLMTATNDGLSSDLYRELYRLTCQSVGYAVVPLLHNLRKLGLFAPKSDWMDTSNSRKGQPSAYRVVDKVPGRRKSAYMYARKYLNLSSSNQSEAPTKMLHPSYVFGGHHSPIICRLIDETLNAKKSANATTDLEEALRCLGLPPGANGQQVALSSGTSVRETLSGATGVSAGNIVLVCFIGGCTYAEVAALRHLATLRHWKLCILTSQILHTKSIITMAGSGLE